MSARSGFYREKKQLCPIVLCTSQMYYLNAADSNDNIFQHLLEWFVVHLFCVWNGRSSFFCFIFFDWIIRCQWPFATSHWCFSVSIVLYRRTCRRDCYCARSAICWCVHEIVIPIFIVISFGCCLIVAVGKCLESMGGCFHFLIIPIPITRTCDVTRCFSVVFFLRFWILLLKSNSLIIFIDHFLQFRNRCVQIFVVVHQWFSISVMTQNLGFDGLRCILLHCSTISFVTNVIFRLDGGQFFQLLCTRSGIANGWSSWNYIECVNAAIIIIIHM